MDSCALSKRDLNAAELDTVRVSQRPTTVVTANGSVETIEEATVNVKDLHLFVTVQLLDDTPLVVSLGQPFEDHGYSYEWIEGQKPNLVKNGRKFLCRTENHVPLVVPGVSSSVRHRDRPDAHHRIHHEEARCMIQYLVHSRNEAQHGKTFWKTCLTC